MRLSSSSDLPGVSKLQTVCWITNCRGIDAVLNAGEFGVYAFGCAEIKFEVQK